MSILSVHEIIIKCDLCGYGWRDIGRTRRELIGWLKRRGWKLGKELICPKCQNEGT